MKEPGPKPTARERLRARLEFYEELGLAPFVRRAGVEAKPSATVAADSSRETRTPPAAEPVVSFAPPTLSLFGETPARVAGDTLERVRADIGDCRRCKLWPHRTNIVFGAGNPRTPLVLVGEAPGADEDAQGQPFVGRAGQLLTQWIESLGMTRQDVYICNVLKCRPPGNRSPERDEIDTCKQFLFRQLEVIRPKLVCALGAVALNTLLGKAVPITRARGRFFEAGGLKIFATFHPAYLLRNPNADREVRQDLRTIREFLG
jgi:DNA polymerase